MNLRSIAIFIFLTFSQAVVYAQDGIYRNESGFETDNDGYLANGSDRYYTAGTFLYFNHALRVENSDSSGVMNEILGFTIGQKIYNPYSAYVSTPYDIDRPFAGYLYISSSINILLRDESNFKFEVQTGFVGPASLAQQTQNVIHNTFGFYTPGGWQYQIHNDFELNLSCNYNQLLARDKNADLSFNGFVALGNGLTATGFGALLRYGSFNYLYNSISTNSTISCNKGMSKLSVKEVFLYYRPVLNIVAYNATIQGGLFNGPRDPNEVVLNKNTFVMNQQIGGSLAYKRWDLDASVIFQSHEVKDMLYPEAWGNITVMYKFN